MTTGELLDFEAAWMRRPRALKESAIIDQLGMRPARYYQLLHRAAASIEGQAHDPITARRVRSRSAHILHTLAIQPRPTTSL